MSEYQPDIIDAVPPDERQENLTAFFQALETRQLDFVDEAGKRIIELTTVLLGLLFGIVAFDNDFPPPYLEDHNATKWLAIAVMLLYLMAMLFGMLTVQPRSYQLYLRNTTKMRDELDKMIRYKLNWLTIAGGTFLVASALLVVLFILIMASA